MSFDKDTRNLLARTVGTCRRRLVDDVTDQLRGMYGLHPDGTVLPIEQLTYLSPDQATAASRLRDLQEHYAAGAAVADRRKAAFERMTLEIAFTALNRLAALRLCEERGLVVECVRKGTASDGFQMFERISGGAIGGRFETYRVFLECLFDELAVDLGVLFDRTTPQSAVFPTERCVEDVLAELNKEELSHLWTEDETIGWIYQYFNPPEERRAMRDASPAPRDSRELAVRNQFFTPRYVVEFLTDNTLGRIWYEMRKGSTALKDACRFLVHLPNETFLGPGESVPASEVAEAELSQEERLKQPVYIDHRPTKDPRDLRVLDPACGSGHFLLYAFDLLERIYEEAWADTESPASEVTGRPLLEDFQSLDELKRAIPKLVVEYNLHGIDIDPRAVQIAALALWLRAQKTWKRLGVKPSERQQVTKSHIVTAEPMPGEEDMRREFIANLRPNVLGQLVDVVFDHMRRAGEMGSLLKIEEDIKIVVSKARSQWIDGPKLEQAELFPDLARSKPEQQQLRFDLTGVTDVEFWEHAEARILAALQDYAERSERGRGSRRRLFAHDTARGFALVDLLSKRYDVVLMNPPFGEAPTISDTYIRRAYPLGYIDLYTAFLDRATSLNALGGLTGAITSRTALTLSSFAHWRKVRFLGQTQISVCADLGYGVLDSAMVETAAYTICRHSPDRDMFFVDLDRVADKEAELFESVHCNRERVFLVQPDQLLALPNATIAYFLDSSSRADFATLPPVSALAEVLGGNATSDDERFIRCFWEIPPPSLRAGLNRRWRWISKGGEYSLFYTSIHLVVDWRSDGGYLGDYMYAERPRNGYLWGPKSWSSAYMGIPGVVWSLRSQKGVSFRALPADCALSGKSAIVTTRDAERDLAFLGILNTERIGRLSRSLATFGSYEKGAIASLPVELKHASRIATESRRAFRAALNANSVSESDPHFPTTIRSNKATIRAVLAETRETISSYADAVMTSLEVVNKCYRDGSLSPEAWRVESLRELAETFSICDVVAELVGYIFGRWDIRIALDQSLAPTQPGPFEPLPACQPGLLVGPDGLPALSNQIASGEWLRSRSATNAIPAVESVASAVIPDSQYPLVVNWDRFLVDDPGFGGGPMHRDDVVRRVRETLDVIWKERAHDIEQEACEILGVAELREYFRQPAGFFQHHLKQYSKSRRKAPIYWPLSTASGSYTIWIYYNRLTDQTLYKAVNLYVEPKIAEVELGVARLEEELTSASGRGARLTDQLSAARSFLSELRAFREELLRIAALPYRPNLNDGVVINAAPFHKLFRLRSWAKDTEECWKSLAKGHYDWAHLAYTIWPDRVREVGKRDRSIAIAHGLEDLCESPAPGAKKNTRGRGKRKAAAAEEES